LLRGYIEVRTHGRRVGGIELQLRRSLRDLGEDAKITRVRLEYARDEFMGTLKRGILELRPEATIDGTMKKFRNRAISLQYMDLPVRRVKVEYNFKKRNACEACKCVKCACDKE
jgi:hypothetical protein